MVGRSFSMFLVALAAAAVAATEVCSETGSCQTTQSQPLLQTAKTKLAQASSSTSEATESVEQGDVLQASQYGAELDAEDIGTGNGLTTASSAACEDVASSSKCLGKQYSTDLEDCSDDGYTGHYWRTKCVKTCGYCDDPRYVDHSAADARRGARATLRLQIPWATFIEQSSGTCPTLLAKSTCEAIAGVLGLEFSSLDNKLNPAGCFIRYQNIPNKMVYNSASPSSCKDCSSKSSCVCPEVTEHTIQQKSTMHYLYAWPDNAWNWNNWNYNDFSANMRNAQEDDSQKWILTMVGDSEYTIQQKNTKRYLDAWPSEYSGLTFTDWSIVTRAGQGDSSQTWIITPSLTSSEDYLIMQKFSSRFVDAYETAKWPHNDYRVRTNDIDWGNPSDPTQRWILTPPLPPLPTPRPTPSPPTPPQATPEPTPRPQIITCHSSCEKNPRTWSQKCTWPGANGCKGCSICPVTCLQYCAKHSAAWGNKCGWTGCIHCDECGENE